ncbi:hypothetical protein, partial [Achromobacter insolitus]|uniref:hypothetical protein n=1 Tax=Achromobacter insolitus TaxID=217204 RepID=UPI002FDDDA0C
MTLGSTLEPSRARPGPGVARTAPAETLFTGRGDPGAGVAAMKTLWTVAVLASFWGQTGAQGGTPAVPP